MSTMDMFAHFRVNMSQVSSVDLERILRQPALQCHASKPHEPQTGHSDNRNPHACPHSLTGPGKREGRGREPL